jgi:hypothetical protein
MPKSACSVGNQNVEAGDKERGSGEKTTFVAKKRKTLAKKNCIILMTSLWLCMLDTRPKQLIDIRKCQLKYHS